MPEVEDTYDRRVVAGLMRRVEQLESEARGLRGAMSWVLRLCQTQKESEYDHILHVDIPGYLASFHVEAYRHPSEQDMDAQMAKMMGEFYATKQKREITMPEVEDEQKGVDWRIVADSVIRSAVLTSTDGQLQQCQYCGKSARFDACITHIDWCAFMAASRLIRMVEDKYHGEL